MTYLLCERKTCVSLPYITFTPCIPNYIYMRIIMHKIKNLKTAMHIASVT